MNALELIESILKAAGLETFDFRFEIDNFSSDAVKQLESLKIRQPVDSKISGNYMSLITSTISWIRGVSPDDHSHVVGAHLTDCS